MTRPPLYISYGMPKSGSTLAFELTRTMLELAGVPQVKIADGVTDPKYPINFVNRLDGEAYQALGAAVAGNGPPLVIKTHSRLFPAVGKGLASGALAGHAVCRDPRDMALSMLDAAREGRAWGGRAGDKFKSVADTLPSLHKSIRTFTKWAESPNIMAIHYERLAFDMESVTAEIAVQLGIDVDLRKAVEIATGCKFTQLNKGISQRWKTEMQPADASLLEKEFKDYIATWCCEVPSVPTARKPTGGLLAKWLPKRS